VAGASAELVPHRRLGRVRTRRSVDPAAGVRRRRREKQVPNRRLCAPEAGDRTKHQLLMELRGTRVQRATHQARVLLLEAEWREDVPTPDLRPEPRSVSLDLLFDALDQP